MADEQTGVKISLLPSASGLADADVLAGVQGNTTKKFSLSAIKSFVISAITATGIGAVPSTRTVNNKALSSNISLDASDVGAVSATEKGAANGVAELDENGQLPTSQLPSTTVSAGNVSYDNTTSGLTATDVQDAIDELAQGGGGGGSSGQGIFKYYHYLNTGSGSQVIIGTTDNYQTFFIVGQGGIHGAVNAMNGGTPSGNIAISSGTVGIALSGTNNIKLSSLGTYKDINVYSNREFTLSLT